jgi:transglutaminase-like putative cysteine protease
MRLKVTHRTRYLYASAVRESFNEARLHPTTNDHQTCENFLLRVLPAVRLKHYHDLYANIVHYFDISAPHTTLDVESTSRIVTRHTPLALDATPWEISRIGELLRYDRCPVTTWRIHRSCGDSLSTRPPDTQTSGRLRRP